ncbi:MAG TPA: DnaB-like helicase N-terminal domain-containing protein, partial [Kamptonema sp.]|nr:DnaB-like helicase N-terminal domain-containing protein [Kamptonema sp.]
MIAILPQKPLRFYDVDYSTPCNIEAEEAVIGGILIDPGAMARVMETKLESDHFIIISHQIIYRAFRQLHAQDKPIDLMTVTIWLAENKLLEEVGGSHKLAQVAERTVSAVNIDAYALLIRDKFVQRSVIEFANNALVLGQQNIPVDDLLDRLKAEAEALEGFRVKDDGAVASESEIRFNALCKELEKIEAHENPAYQDLKIKELAKEWGFRSTKELLDLHAKFLDSRHRKGEKLTYGLTEYFEKFADSSTDWLIRGWIPNKVVTVLHAAGGVGKTRLVSSICRALIAGKSWSGYDVDTPTCVLFIETDQGVVVNIKMIDEQGYLDEPEEVRARFRFNDNWNINQYGKLKAMLNEFRELHPDSKILVVIDSLTTVSTNARFSENDQEFARPLVRFRAIAEEFNCSFLVLHHSNRAGECRGSTAIFNAADQVWKLERVNKNAPAGPLFLDIQKTRVRAPGRYVLEYSDQTWTWTITGRVAADDSIESGFTPTQQAILRYLSKYSGIGFEAEDLAEACNIGLSTCRKELGVLGNEALISSVKQGRPRKVYFIGTLTSKP